MEANVTELIKKNNKAHDTEEKKNFNKMVYDKKSKTKIQIVNKIIIEIIN